MFNCTVCHKTTAANERAHKIVLEKRQRSYTNRRVIEDEEGKRKVIVKDSEGWEIVKEVLACGECATKGN